MFTGATEEEFIDDALEEDVDVDLNDDVNDLVTVGDEEEDLEDYSSSSFFCRKIYIGYNETK